MHCVVLILVPPHAVEYAESWIGMAMQPFCDEFEEPERCPLSFEKVAAICRYADIDLTNPNTDPTTDPSIFKAIVEYCGGDPRYDPDSGYTYLSYSNPKGEWDWYRIGGRWDGWIIDNPQSSEKGFNFSILHETLKNNSIMASKLIKNGIKEPACILCDGEWYKAGCYDNWGQKVEELLSSHIDHLVVALDTHN